MKKLSYIFSAAVMLFILSMSAGAADFIFKYKDDVVRPMSLDDSAEHLVDSYFTSDDEEELQRLLELGLIEYYEPNAEVFLMDEPNDPEYIYGQRSYEFRITNALGVVNNGSYDGRRVRVGIIDTGLIEGHEDIDYSRIYSIQSSVPGSTTTLDTVGHGTAVAGIIAAATNNEKGVASLAPGVELVIIKAFPDDQESTNTAYLANGLSIAINQGCDVINMSVGFSDMGNTQSRTVKEFIDQANERGIIVVAASGNHNSKIPDNPDADSPYMYPAAYDNVISVGAINSYGERASFSYHNDAVTVVAPGEYVRTLGISGPSSYIRYNGTSFSSPFVAAVAAIVKQLRPDITADEFIDLLAETSTDAGDPGYDTYFGYGIVNVGAVLDTLLASDEPADQIIVGDIVNTGLLSYECTIRNNGYEALELLDVWFSEKEGYAYQRKVRRIELEPHGEVTITYDGYYNIVHFVWLGDSLMPLCPKQVLDSGIW